VILDSPTRIFGARGRCRVHDSTSTGAAKALKLVIPELAASSMVLHARAYPERLVVDLVVFVENKTSKEEVTQL